MNKILFTIAVIFGIGLPTTYAQSDSVGHPWLIEELQQVKTAKDSAVVYYKDFVYSHSGMYYSHNLVYSSKISKTLTFPYSPDSALAIFSRLYRQEGMEYLYYPIVQLEHALGLPHDFTIVPPDTSVFYMPLQSGTYDELNSGWETNYKQHIYPCVEWAWRHCKTYTTLFQDVDEPDLWHGPQDTVLRLTVTHKPVGGQTIIRVYKHNGQPMAVYRSVDKKHSGLKPSYNVQNIYNEQQLTSEQWHEIMNKASTIDSLPWKERVIHINRNFYWYEYRHDSSYRSYYSHKDRVGLWQYLIDLFENSPKQMKH